MIWGRNTELGFLSGFAEKQKSQVVVLYGVHGVGKTELIREFTRTKRTAYFACRDCSDREQRYQWGTELNTFSTGAQVYPSYLELLTASCQDAEVLVLDEFRYLIESGEDFLPQLRMYLQQRDRTLLVLLLSASVSWVENQMVRQMQENALLLSGMLKIRPLDYATVCKAFPGYQAMDQAVLYGILGGVPAYWQQMDPGRTLEDNLCRFLISQNAPGRFCCQMILREELRELNVYQTLLGTLASGKHKLNDLYHQTGYSRAKISVYLKNLMQMELVEKIFPVEEGNAEQVQKGLYRICNPLFSFVYTYLYPNSSELQRLSPAHFYHSCLKEQLPYFAETGFRQICMEYLLTLEKEGKLSIQAVSHGEWPGKRAALELVLCGADGRNLLGYSCFHANVTMADVEWLGFAAKEAGLTADERWFFTAADFDEDVKKMAGQDRNCHLVRLSEIQGQEKTTKQS